VGGTLAGYAVLAFLPDHRAERFAGRLRGIPGVGGSLAEFWTAVWLYHKQPRALAEALGLSVLGHAGFVLVFYLAARAFADPGALPRLAEHYLIIPVGLTFQALVPTPGGVGAGEAGFGGLYASVGTPAVAGVLGSLGNRLITWIIGLVGYIVFLRMRAAEGQPTTTRAEVEPPATAGKSPVLPAGAQG
jgi:uncharacterized membrane protein YbhN (UPF0104 family)